MCPQPPSELMSKLAWNYSLGLVKLVPCDVCTDCLTHWLSSRTRKYFPCHELPFWYRAIRLTIVWKRKNAVLWGSSSEGHKEKAGVISIGNGRKYSFKYIQHVKWHFKNPLRARWTQLQATAFVSAGIGHRGVTFAQAWIILHKSH